MGYRIQRYQKSLALTHAGAATTVTFALPSNINGLLRGLKVKTPAAVDGSATVTFNILDADNDAIYALAGLAVNTKTSKLIDVNNQPLAIPIAGGTQIQVVFSAAQTVTDTISIITLLLDR